MSIENPTGQEGGASIHDRLESFLSAGDEPKEQDQPEGQDDPEVKAEPNTDEPDDGEQEQDEGPQLTTADLARFLKLEESALDLDEEGNVQLKTKIDGKEGAAKLQDLLKSYQLQGHIDNKSREVAERERAVQAWHQQQAQAIHSQMQQLESMTQLAHQELMREYQSLDWNALRVQDPAEYSAKLADFQIREGQLKQAMGSIEQSKAQQQWQQGQQLQAFLAEQAQKLPELIPEWKDEATAKKESAALKEWGVKQGLDPQELATIGKAAYVSILRKAWQYDQLQQSKAPIENKVRTAPKLVKPGQAQTGNRDQQNVANLKANVRKSGGKGDAVTAYLLATGKA